MRNKVNREVKPIKPRRCLRVHSEVEITKQVAIFFQFKLKTTKSALYKITINDVALGLGTYPQIATGRLCGPVPGPVFSNDLRIS